MTKSQIIRELTIELVIERKKSRELERSLSYATSLVSVRDEELRQALEDNKTLEEIAKDYTLQCENERTARERALEHVKALEAEIERMREDTMALLVDEYGATCALDRFKKALGIIP